MFRKKYIERLYAQKEEIEKDIEYTQKALEDPKIDYLTKKEYQNDLIYDRRRISELNMEIECQEELEDIKVKQLKLR